MVDSLYHNLFIEEESVEGIAVRKILKLRDDYKVVTAVDNIVWASESDEQEMRELWANEKKKTVQSWANTLLKETKQGELKTEFRIFKPSGEQEPQTFSWIALRADKVTTTCGSVHIMRGDVNGRNLQEVHTVQVSASGQLEIPPAEADIETFEGAVEHKELQIVELPMRSAQFSSLEESTKAYNEDHIRQQFLGVFDAFFKKVDPM